MSKVKKKVKVIKIDLDKCIGYNSIKIKWLTSIKLFLFFSFQLLNALL